MASINKVPRIKLGSQGMEVSKQGLGAMGMSAFYGPPKPEQDMIDLIHHAVETGVTFIDTSDIYGPHTNEILVGKAIKGIREKVQLATKFGNIIENGVWTIRGDPEYVHQCVAGSLKRLDTDYIDLYYQHRVDVSTPIEITMGVLKKYVQEGKIKYIGLSEASAADIRRAHAVHPITAVQSEWSLWSRDLEEDIIPTCRELGIGIVPYSPLGRGFFSGLRPEQMDASDNRKSVGFPRFAEENLKRNEVFYEKLVAIAAKKNATAGQLALAWVQEQGDDVAPIPGTTRVKNFDENVRSLTVKISPEEMKEIEDAVPHNEVAGARYSKEFMEKTWQHLSSAPLSSWKGPTM